MNLIPPSDAELDAVNRVLLADGDDESVLDVSEWFPALWGSTDNVVQAKSTAYV